MTGPRTGAGNRRKGNAAEAALATWLRTHGHPHAERRGGGFGGSDIVGTPGLTFEAKNQVRAAFPEWVDQTERARATAGDRYGILCVKRIGTTDVGQWFGILPMEQLARLLADAGWADPAWVTADEEGSAA